MSEATGTVALTAKFWLSTSAAGLWKFLASSDPVSCVLPQLAVWAGIWGLPAL